jgi:hypothetical protein
VAAALQTDVSPLLKAFPALESLRIRGGSHLSISQVQHLKLKELAIESGGLGRSVLREILLCDLPELEHLELLLGEENYGFDGTVEDLQPLLSGRLFPKSTYLELMNGEIANDIAAAVVNSPIAQRIESLDCRWAILRVKESSHYMGSPFTEISSDWTSRTTSPAMSRLSNCECFAMRACGRGSAGTRR